MIELVVLAIIAIMSVAFYLARAPRRVLIEQWLNARHMTLTSIKRDWSMLFDRSIEGHRDQRSEIECYHITATRTDTRSISYRGDARVRKIAGQYSITVVWENRNPLLDHAPKEASIDINQDVERRLDWLRQNPQELQKYDMDGNGYLDAEEWERVRFLVREEIKSRANTPPNQSW